MIENKKENNRLSSPTGRQGVFLNENFLLQTATAQTLYHQFAKEMPVIDYHCHLSPEQIAEDKTFENLTQA